MGALNGYVSSAQRRSQSLGTQKYAVLRIHLIPSGSLTSLAVEPRIIILLARSVPVNGADEWLEPDEG